MSCAGVCKTPTCKRKATPPCRGGTGYCNDCWKKMNSKPFLMQQKVEKLPECSSADVKMYVFEDRFFVGGDTCKVSWEIPTVTKLLASYESIPVSMVKPDMVVSIYITTSIGVQKVKKQVVLEPKTESTV